VDEPGIPDPPEVDAPVLPESPRWVPAAVVAGAVLLIEGFIVSRIKPDAAEGSPALVGDIALVSFFLGSVALLAGYCAFLLSKVSLPRAMEGLVLSGVALFSYYATWFILVTSLSGDAASLPGFKEAGLEGRGAALGAIGAIAAFTGIFTAAFKWWTGIVWPHFRGWVALNVMAMVHLVVLLLGVASYLNVRFVPRWEWATVDLTETGQFSLSDKTRAVLGKVEGEVLAFSVDYGASRRTGSGIKARVLDLLRQYQAACPRMSFRPMDALRAPDDLRKAFLEAGMEGILDTLTGEEDVVVFGFRPVGEKLVVRTKVVPVNQEFADTSALGSERFRGEGILTNALSEVVFAQRKIAFLEGHGEKSTMSAGPTKSVSVLSEALRGDNFTVVTLNLTKEPAIPADVDLVFLAGPASALGGGEVEALRAYLGRGGAAVVLLKDPEVDPPRTGLDDLLESYGIRPQNDTVIVSWFVESTVTQGNLATPTNEVIVEREEFGRHPAMAALRSSTFALAFRNAVPVLRTDKAPEGVDVQDLVFAPREVQGYRPFGARLRKGRTQFGQPAPGDIVDKRLPVGVTAERKAGEGSRGGGRLVVFGDADFATDLRLEPNSPAVAPGNRTLLLNAVSWAVRRDLIAIDPKSVETEMVQLRSIDRDLAFWAMVVSLPVLVLGVAVGMWWVRRR
jgi:hypothetical protein